MHAVKIGFKKIMKSKTLSYQIPTEKHPLLRAYMSSWTWRSRGVKEWPEWSRGGGRGDVGCGWDTPGRQEQELKEAGLARAGLCEVVGEEVAR